PSAAAFLTSYDDGVVTVATRTDAVLGEQLLVEISFPGLPNRALLRAVVDGLLIDEEGLRVKISDADSSTCDFMLRIAKGELKMAAQREHRRSPAPLAVSYPSDKGPDPHRGVVDDRGGGGTFALPQSPPPVGSHAALTIETPDGKGVKCKGVVAWVKTGPGAN